MNDNIPDHDPNRPDTQPGFVDRHEERWRRRAERRADRGGRSGGAWMGGAVLIILGIYFLLQNIGAVVLNNWWAIFILLPAVGAFGNAWQAYQNSGGRLTAPARGSLLGGMALTMVAGIFLFNLNWGLLGPVIIILVGVGLLLNSVLPG